MASGVVQFFQSLPDPIFDVRLTEINSFQHSLTF